VPEPVAFYPLNARYKAAEKENRQPMGILGDVAITNGPYGEPGGAYMFYGTKNSYIEFPNNGGLDTRFSITLMCWVQPGGQDGPLFNDRISSFAVSIQIIDSKFVNQMVTEQRSGEVEDFITWTTETLPAGKWVHVAASYDHNTGINSLYINGHLNVSESIGTGYEIATIFQRDRMGAGDNEYFKGKIAEMKVYDVALNEEQIQTSIKKGSCTFFEIVLSLPSPVFRLINEALIIGHFRKR